jgi:hypothetical protein
MFCFVSIVKREHLLLPIFGFPTKNTKKYISKNIFENKKIGVRKGCWNSHKMARNWLRRFRNTSIEI